ncbi:uncharacterized protein N7496_006497 [Penicillium cataractarum]|uniref:Uncharacterized protein n=1 Tax=Penicillium cataractarum TaxID=2100454 RepID=A0A9W9V8K6_9EURO|nr:uncharacterized protein N7496_006497 [Penicillium cataractarum]KAJ5370405.1 hypothetical protein N7496_006497 [Penicillium cataractarum]
MGVSRTGGSSHEEIGTDNPLSEDDSIRDTSNESRNASIPRDSTEIGDSDCGSSNAEKYAGSPVKHVVTPQEGGLAYQREKGMNDRLGGLGPQATRQQYLVFFGTSGFASLASWQSRDLPVYHAVGLTRVGPGEPFFRSAQPRQSASPERNASIQGGHYVVASGSPAHNKKESVQFCPSLVVAIVLSFIRQFESAQKLGAHPRLIALPAPAFCFALI